MGASCAHPLTLQVVHCFGPTATCVASVLCLCTIMYAHRYVCAPYYLCAPLCMCTVPIDTLCSLTVHVQVVQGYGLTETGAASFLAAADDMTHFATVGAPTPATEFK